MNPTLVPDPLLTGAGQRELSRRASERHLLLAAVAERRRRGPARTGLVRRFRHALARGLVAAARLVDAPEPAPTPPAAWAWPTTTG